MALSFQQEWEAFLTWYPKCFHPPNEGQLVKWDAMIEAGEPWWKGSDASPAKASALEHLCRKMKVDLSAGDGVINTDQVVWIYRLRDMQSGQWSRPYLIRNALIEILDWADDWKKPILLSIDYGATYHLQADYPSVYEGLVEKVFERRKDGSMIYWPR